MRVATTFIGIAFAVIACEGGTVPEGVPTSFTRSFATAYCWSGQPTPTPTSCATYSAASYSLYVDSVRVAFENNNSVQWKIGAHRYECPCYLGGCTTPCSHQPGLVTQVSGTYSISADTLILQFSESPDPQASAPNTKRLYTSFPDKVPADWAGPDSLIFDRVFGSVILRSP